MVVPVRPAKVAISYVGGVGGTRYARHHLAADEMVLARAGGKHVHVLRAGQTSDDGHGVRAADLDGIEDLVGSIGSEGCGGPLQLQ